MFLQIGIMHAHGNVDYGKYYDKYKFVACGQVIDKYPNGYTDVDGPRYVVRIENKYKDAENIQTFDAVGLGIDTNGPPQRVAPLEIGEKGVFFVNTQDNHYSISNNYVKVTKCNSNFIPTPLGQYKFGVDSEKVFCLDSNHHLIIKLSDSSPVCVTSETKNTLVERGWAKLTTVEESLTDKQ